MEIVYLAVGILIGFIISFFMVKLKLKSAEFKLLEMRGEYEQNRIKLEEKLIYLQTEKKNLTTEVEHFESQNLQQLQQLAKKETEFENLQEKLAEHKKELEELQKKLTTEFENIANRILEKNSEKFTAANQKNLGDVLNPLKEKIQLFEKKVEDTYKQGLKDQTDLRAELKKLFDLNSKISKEATDLTRALKGDVKKQGNWGEVVLERILERSGLNEGAGGYEKQFSDNSEEGKRIQPDIVINLPDNKHIIIDSKVSLIAYERAVNAAGDEERALHIKGHLLSLKTHIKGLSEKHYQTAKNLNSPDFVLLFIPVESSFSLAVQEDQDLFSFAWDLKVVLVSPSTLLATLRTIASIWQQENQTRNAIEIARQGGALYDKFVGFVNDMENIGKNLDTTRKTYDAAVNKLQTGQGNLISRAESIKKLGAKTTKELPKVMLND